MAAPEGEESVTRPDPAPVTDGRMADRGPRYTETPPDPYAPGSPPIAEPWNAASASLFVVVVAAWAWRLRGRYRDYPVLVCCLAILLAGGIGGTLYHAFRTRPLYFLLDTVPISLLGLAGAVFMAVRYWGGRGWWILPAVGAFYVAVEVYFTFVSPANVPLSANLSYGSLAAVVIIPIATVLVRTRFRHGGWVAAGFVSFAIAWFFRLVDLRSGPYLSAGTHWLWHVFGAVATALIIEFFYKVEGERAGGEPRGHPRTGGPDG